MLLVAFNSDHSLHSKELQEKNRALQNELAEKTAENSDLRRSAEASGIGVGRCRKCSEMQASRFLSPLRSYLKFRCNRFDRTPETNSCAVILAPSLILHDDDRPLFLSATKPLELRRKTSENTWLQDELLASMRASTKDKGEINNLNEQVNAWYFFFSHFFHQLLTEALLQECIYVYNHISVA
jgi:hypothetical protein